MLDGEKFEITLEERDIGCLKDVLKLYEKIHCSTGATFKTSLHAKGEVLLVQECYSKEEESYPLDVILPMINYKVEKLPQTKEGYYDGDGDNYSAVKIFVDSHGIKMKRVYVYAGK